MSRSGSDCAESARMISMEHIVSFNYLVREDLIYAAVISDLLSSLQNIKITGYYNPRITPMG